MDTGRLISILQGFREQQQSLQIPQLFAACMQIAQEYVSSPSDKISSRFVQALQSLTQALRADSSNDLQPLSRSLLETAVPPSVYGETLAQRLEDGTRQAPTPPILRDAITTAHNEYTQRMSAVENLLIACEAIGIKEYSAAQDQGEISIVLPEALTKGDVEALYGRMKEWSRIISHIAEVVSDAPKSPEFLAVERGSFVVTMVTVYLVAKGLLELVDKALDVLIKSQEFAKTRSTLKEQGVDEETVKAVKDKHAGQITKQIRQISDEFIGRSAQPNLADSRKNELRNAIEKNIRTIVKQINQGVEIQIALPPAPAGDSGEQGAQPSNRGISAMVEIKSIARRWRVLGSVDDDALCLPEGDSTSTTGPSSGAMPATCTGQSVP